MDPRILLQLLRRHHVTVDRFGLTDLLPPLVISQKAPAPDKISKNMSKHKPKSTAQDVEQVEEQMEVIHKRTKVVNHDNNIDLILAGRAKKISIEVPEEPKVANQRMQKIIMESENEFKHLMGEVTAEVYEIFGRPELTLVSIGYASPPVLLPKPIVIAKSEFEEDEDSADAKIDVPANIAEIKLLFHSAKSYFLLSPKVEDRLLANLKDYPAYEMEVKSAIVRFGDQEFSVLDNKVQRLWRRFVREYMHPLLRDLERLELMEDRLNFEIPYTDDVIIESEHNTDSDEDVEKTKKKRGKKKKGGAKKKPGTAGDKPGSAEAGFGASSKENAMQSGPSTSARVMQRMSTKKGIGLLAKRASVKDIK